MRRLACVGGASAVVLLALPGAVATSDLSVDLTNLRSHKGSVRVCLTADPQNFPACIDDAQAVTRSIPATTGSLRFDGLTHGDYAVAVIHDENNNRKLDTFAGIPREGFGFSRNPAVSFGPPRFAAARFTLTGDADRQQIKMRYLL
nr:DUF2141 domain-containing protein [Sphingomonas glacialis]